MIYFLTAVLALALVISSTQRILLKRELARLADAMDENHTGGACRQLTVGIREASIARLAAAINVLYDDIVADRAANRVNLADLRKDMTNISHDLRTPLTSIIGYLKLMQNDSAPDEKHGHYMTVVTQKAQELNSLVGGLFELALLESGGHVFQYRHCDANAILAEELAGLYAQFEKSCVLPEVKLSEGSIWIIGDTGALQRIFSNLLHNMLKHGQSPMMIASGTNDSANNSSADLTGISSADSTLAYDSSNSLADDSANDSASILPNVPIYNSPNALSNESAWFRFTNKAPQLQEKDIPLLFQRFFTADRMRSGKDTGLGLAIVKEFTEQMNGSISARLQDGFLTISVSFREISLPLVQ